MEFVVSDIFDCHNGFTLFEEIDGMRLLYFAWVRSKIGVAEEEVSPPDTIKTVSDLLDWLCERDVRYAEAFSHRQVIRVAVNQEFTSLDHVVGLGDEVALFPPVTGG